jgi:hypothetical protein
MAESRRTVIQEITNYSDRNEDTPFDEEAAQNWSVRAGFA